jgi:hypothetical protein
MERVLTWMRMLGTSGAVANARLLSEERERERWAVDGLQARLLARAVNDPQVTAA